MICSDCILTSGLFNLYSVLLQIHIFNVGNVGLV
jgi:hypothetical protein